MVIKRVKKDHTVYNNNYITKKIVCLGKKKQPMCEYGIWHNNHNNASKNAINEISHNEFQMQWIFMLDCFSIIHLLMLTCKPIFYSNNGKKK